MTNAETNPGCPTNVDLERFADDEAGAADVSDHLTRCQRCRERVEELRTTNDFVLELAAAGAYSDLIEALYRLGATLERERAEELAINAERQGLEDVAELLRKPRA